VKNLSSLILVFATFAFADSNAFAAPAGLQCFALTCKGQELAVGNSGKQGTLLITATNDVAADKDNEAWNLSVKWTDSSEMLLANGFVCGTPIPSSVTCSLHREGPINLATHFFAACTDEGDEGRFDTRGLPHHVAEAALSLDSKRDHGGFYCRQDKQIRILLTNCRAL